MKTNKLTIRINKPTSEVFEFTVNPENTAKWIESIKKEESSYPDIEIGATYTNWDKDGKESTYFVTNFEKNKVFELKSSDGCYSVKYTYVPISGTVTELEYLEWNDCSDLESPFEQKTMEKLKEIMESY